MTDSGQTTTQSRTEPMVEALIMGLIENAAHPKAVSRSEDVITAAMIEALMAPSTQSARSASQSSRLETAILAAALAPALAEALVPALTEALEPSIIKALNTIVSARKPEQDIVSTRKTEQEATAENPCGESPEHSEHKEGD